MTNLAHPLLLLLVPGLPLLLAIGLMSAPLRRIMLQLAPLCGASGARGLPESDIERRPALDLLSV